MGWKIEQMEHHVFPALPRLGLLPDQLALLCRVLGPLSQFIGVFRRLLGGLG